MGKGDDSVRALIKDLRSNDLEKKKKAIFLIGEKKIIEAEDDLIKLLKDSKDRVVRNSAARALGKIKSKKSVDQLIESLKDEDYYVRLNSAWALGKIGEQKSVAPLVQLIKNGGAKVYSFTGSQVEVKQDNVDEELLKDEGMKYHDVQINAIKALGEIGDERAVGALIAEANDEDGHIRAAIALALGKIKSKKAVPKLIELLNDTMWYVRRDAAIALGKIGDLRSVDVLVDKLDDNYHEVKDKAAKAIEKMGKKAITKAFLLKHNNTVIQGMLKKVFKSNKKELIDTINEIINEIKDIETKEKFKQFVSRL
ncbi:MAG: HEAT repeat domain-containing protein [Promethearchaeota archaeon]